MKYLDEYRDAEAVGQYAELIARAVTRPWTIMEVCGGQTHSIVRYGIDALLPDAISLIHGPGCPVCVTPLESIDKALAIAARPEVIFCTFGDMLRVPGSRGDLYAVKAAGGDVRVVYSPVQAVQIAAQNPERQVVFFGVGFETTAPATALALRQARAQNLENFSMLVSHVLVPPAMEAILASESCRVQGFLGAGHVCAVAGTRVYEPIVEKFQVPVVATGFEPLDLLQGILMCVRQLEEGRAEVEIQYGRGVRPDGNEEAWNLVLEVFRVVSRIWRGIGEIPGSGLGFAEAYRAFDAERRFPVGDIVTRERSDCIGGEILQGARKPVDCPVFGRLCTPENPLGALMVSGEGACAAYYRYRGRENRERPQKGE